jgi:hypothetical protein
MRKNGNQQPIYAPVMIPRVRAAFRSRLLKAPPSPINGHTEITMVETSCNGMMNGDSDKNDNSKVPANIQDEQTMTPKGESIAAKAKRAKEKLEMKRERKAAVTGVPLRDYFLQYRQHFYLSHIVFY